MKYINVFVRLLALALFLFIVYSFLTQYGMFSNINKNGYLDTNDWSMIPNKDEYEQEGSIKGVEVRVLDPPHILAGQRGVFATKQFSKYDVIGEYSGIIKKDDDTDPKNLYIFTLVDDVCIDGETHSNELKYVNSHLNIDHEPNLVPSMTYINKEPKVLYVCRKDINIGEELLIDYGEEYNVGHIYKN
jgi:hypothetical protein